MVMDKNLVIVVPNEVNAYEVVKALQALDDRGSIELYASTVVMKSPDSQLSVKDSHEIDGAWAALLGMSTGALVGLLAGPVGMAAGAAIGAATGVGAELTYTGFSGDFIQAVAAQLQPGSWAVCASLWEDWTVPVDVAIQPYGAVVFRQATDDDVVAQMKADWQTTKDDLAHLEAELAHTAGEEKAKLEAKRDELRKKQAALRKKLQERAQKLQDGYNAQIAAIKAKAEKARTNAKRRHEGRVEKLTRFAAEQKQAFHELFS
jgi:uncharacterized membrane protein